MKCPVCEHEGPAADFGEPLRCPECGAFYEKAVLAKAQKESATQVPSAPSGQGSRQGHRPASQEKRTSVLTWIVLLVVGGFLIKACTSGESTRSSTVSDAKPKCSSSMAHVMAGNFVKRELRSPSTAKFPYTSDRDVVVNDLGNCRFSISSYVDSQNGFGAMIRSRFSVVMQSTPDGHTWTAKDLVIN